MKKLNKKWSSGCDSQHTEYFVSLLKAVSISDSELEQLKEKYSHNQRSKESVNRLFRSAFIKAHAEVKA